VDVSLKIRKKGAKILNVYRELVVMERKSRRSCKCSPKTFWQNI